MAKRRPSGDGMVRKREDGRWEGRYTAGYDPKTGKRRTINGTLQNKMPAAYYITRENIK